MKKNFQTINITHGDVDGMVCAAQIIRRENNECLVLFSDARYISSKLKSLVKWASVPKRIYITDIPANLEAAELCGKLSGKGAEIYWIDHHPWFGEGIYEKIRQVCKQVVYNEALNTPAGVLLGNWLKPEDDYYERTGKICFAFEKGNDWERNWFRLLSSYVGKADVGVLERLAFGRDFTADDLKQIERQKELETISADILAEEPEVEITANNRKLAVYDTSDLPGVYLGHKVFKCHAVDYCLIRIKMDKWQLASRPGEGLTLESVVGSHNVGNMKVTAAGRPKQLLALTVDNDQVPGNANSVLVGWLKENL